MAGRSSLSARLKLLKNQVEKNQQNSVDTAVPGGAKYSAKNEKTRPLGDEWEQIGRYSYRCVTTYPDPLPQGSWPSLFLPGVGRWDQLSFIDTETTGLSGGAGTVAFLVGCGKWTMHGEFEITQLFLSDYPGETDYLGHVAALLDPEACLISYNGASFDLPLLATRFRMNGLSFPQMHHMDLLYPSRRFWKTLLESCSLSTVEERILGVARKIDLPGAEVPERYFAYLKCGDSGLLDEVFAHHGQDILSLAHLFTTLEHILRSPLEAYADGYGIGRTMLELGIDGWAEVLLRAFESGNQAAGRYLAIQAKRLGDWERCLPVWSGMIGKEYGFWASVELAKFYEHQQKDPMSALAVVKKLCDEGRPPAGFQTDIERRIARLSKKIEGRNPHSSDS